MSIGVRILVILAFILSGQLAAKHGQEGEPQVQQPHQVGSPPPPSSSHALRPPSDDPVLASTLDGALVALEPRSGDILWQIKDQPVVKSPYDPNKPVLPAFLPDPKDGSIYMIGSGLKDPLKKLPFTIPELVAASPCKSSDGILYTGKKVDTWFAIDRYTGARRGSVSFNGCLAGGQGADAGGLLQENSCPTVNPANFLIGRTEYNIMMFDSRAGGRKWNISFFDYTSNLGSGDDDVGMDYEFAHFTDSSTGKLLTLDRNSGRIQWEKRIGSPIVAMYKLKGDGIVSVPFTSVSKETLGNLLEQFNAPDTRNEVIGETKLFPTLYVGEHDHGLYAMPSLVDEQTLTIFPSSHGPLLLEGPNNQDYQVPKEMNMNVVPGGDHTAHQQPTTTDPLDIPFGKKDSASDDAGQSSVLLFGYYHVPEHSAIKLSPAVTQLQLTDGTTTNSPPKIPSILSSNGALLPHQTETSLRPTNTDIFYYATKNESVEDADNIVKTRRAELVWRGIGRILNLNGTFLLSKEFVELGMELVPYAVDSLLAVENKELKMIALLLALILLVAFRFITQHPFDASSFRMSNSYSTSSSLSGRQQGITAHPLDLGEGKIQVGKIVFDAKDILGKGCEGTFVYRGRFDNRDVAVKRVLANCFSIADREVELLRESDVHPNVIRYFCMEQDSQFRYIALELCLATLLDFVEGRVQLPANSKPLDPLTMLRQACQGLDHLHNLDIVHRDVKPHNVLISLPGSKGDVRAMISDFGLCKKLNPGKLSFSRRSGVAGTEGWIAPEMMTGQRSNTCAVDIFSLGCVFHFVLSGGIHPFGASYKRQGNILSAQYSLAAIENEATAKHLVEKMIAHDARRRPPTMAILRHPIFWSNQKILSFLQDVSDRVDKEDMDSVILHSLERNRHSVVKNNWQDALDDKVREDLRKHRTYNPKSVRDLLRALRNKKHHYNELSDEVKSVYGRVPDQFAAYWTSRFPNLLMHAWHAMHCVKNEATFMQYFDKNFDFLPTRLVDPMLQLGPDGTRNQNLFEPTFRNGERSREEEDEEEDGGGVVSQGSVVSHWDQLSGVSSFHGQETKKKDDEGDEEEQFLPTRRAAYDVSEAPIEEHPRTRPYLMNEESRRLQDSPIFTAPDENQLSPRLRVRKGPAQLESQAKQNYLKTMSESKRQATFADALRNVAPPREKEDIEEEVAEKEGHHNDSAFVMATNGKEAAAAASLLASDIQSEGGVASVETRSEIATMNSHSPSRLPRVEEEDKIVWKLPPEDNKVKKRKKGKKK